jgi:O-methyltransferase
MKNIIKSLIDLINNSDNKIQLFEHNGESIDKYPSQLGWNLIPFPKEKGNPYNADNLATILRAPFLNDKNFIKARSIAEARWEGVLSKRDISWRLDVMLWAISHSLRVWNNKSIFIECGTGKGYMASAICSYFDWDDTNPDFYLIDSFSPFVPNEKGQQNETSETSFIYSKGDEEIRKYFSKYNKVKILKGFIPEVLSSLPNNEIGFLHIDLNSAVAEKAALDVLKSKLVSGAIVLFDDYGGFGGENQAKVHEHFAESMGGRLLTLPTGQALYFHH